MTQSNEWAKEKAHEIWQKSREVALESVNPAQFMRKENKMSKCQHNEIQERYCLNCHEILSQEDEIEDLRAEVERVKKLEQKAEECVCVDMSHEVAELTNKLSRKDAVGRKMAEALSLIPHPMSTTARLEVALIEFEKIKLALTAAKEEGWIS